MLLLLFAQGTRLLVNLAAIVLAVISTLTSAGQTSLHMLPKNVSASVDAPAAMSRNWAGYVATNGTFTSVTGTWTVPSVSSDGQMGADAEWVGIGGVRRRDLIQSGTKALVDPSGQVTYSAFVEMLPSAAQQISVNVNQGDSVTVSIVQQATHQWQITFKDNTSGQSYQTTTTYFSSLSSAEWIEEAPSAGRRELPLDAFGTVAFGGGSTTKDGNGVSIAQSGAQPITLINIEGQALATPSGLASDGASFTVTRSSAASYPSAPDSAGAGGWRRYGFGNGPSAPFPRPYWRYDGPWSR
jgi:hypothetical protein